MLRSLSGCTEISYCFHGVELVLETRFSEHDVLVNLAQTRADWCHFGRSETGRDDILGFFEAFGNLGPCPINVHVLLKNDGHDAQPETADRAQFDDFWNGFYRLLNRVSDEFFDFLRRQSGGGSDDLYLIVGDVRQCVNGQPR